MELLITMFVGWPAAFGSIALGIYSIVRKRVAWVPIAGLIYLPFALYLFGTPRFRGIALYFPLCYVATALAIKLKMQWLAWITITPVILFTLWLGLVVSCQ